MGRSQNAWSTGRTQRIDDTTTDPRWAQRQATAAEAAEPLRTPVHRSSPWEETLGSQELMGLAVGVLMSRDRLSPETARAALIEAAGTRERGLAEIATAVIDTTVGQEQARRLQATMTTACINRPDLWLRHFSLGGDVTEFEIDAYLHQALLLPQFQRDQLADAVNDILEQTAPPRAFYTCEVLAGLTPAPSTGGQHDGTTRSAQNEATDPDGPHAPGPCPENL